MDLHAVALSLWNRLHNDNLAVIVTFYKVDKGWWRLSPAPGRHHDFYAKRVGEGTKGQTDAGIQGQRSSIVFGLEFITELSQALVLCNEV